MIKIAEGCATFIDMEIDLLILAEEAFNQSISEQQFMEIYNKSLSLYYQAAYEICTDGSFLHSVRGYWFIIGILLILLN